jgi:hypothetical protein
MRSHPTANGPGAASPSTALIADVEKLEDEKRSSVATTPTKVCSVRWPDGCPIHPDTITEQFSSSSTVPACHPSRSITSVTCHGGLHPRHRHRGRPRAPPRGRRHGHRPPLRRPNRRDVAKQQVGYQGACHRRQEALDEHRMVGGLHRTFATLSRRACSAPSASPISRNRSRRYDSRNPKEEMSPRCRGKAVPKWRGVVSTPVDHTEPCEWIAVPMPDNIADDPSANKGLGDHAVEASSTQGHLLRRRRAVDQRRLGARGLRAGVRRVKIGRERTR